VYADLDTLVRTRLSWHMLAEHVVSPARYAAVRRIGLELSSGGYATPWFAAADGDRQVAVAGTTLSVAARTAAGVSTRGREISTLRECAEFVGVAPGAPAEVYPPATPLDLDATLTVDAAAANALSYWWQQMQTALESVLATAGSDAGITLWPEHFDLATSFDAVNYGASPGDDWHPAPYVYVGPHAGPGDDPFWNAPFGAAQSWTEIQSADAAVDFFERGRALTT
jgi:hypothetical protein